MEGSGAVTARPPKGFYAAAKQLRARHAPIQAIGVTLAALSGVGSAYQLAHGPCDPAILSQPAPQAAQAEPVTLLKPLYGAEPRLAANLATFLAQDHDAPVQMVCGINTPGIGPLRRRMAGGAPSPRRYCAQSRAARARRQWQGRQSGAMMPLAKHDMLILSDSDMVVQPDYLATVTAALAQPGVGLVTCLYTGRGDAGAWSRIGAAMISFQQTPNMVFRVAHGLAQPCMGSTIALRRETRRDRRFERFADVLADDHAMGAGGAALGLSIAVPPMLLDHAGDEASLAQLWRHFLRWAVTIRDLNPGAMPGRVTSRCRSPCWPCPSRLPPASSPCVAPSPHGWPSPWPFVVQRAERRLRYGASRRAMC
jgi:ceramide glucosyltransferase